MTTNGVSLFYNLGFMESLNAAELAGVLAHEVKGPDVWEFRYCTYEYVVRKQRQLTLSSKKYPSEVAVKRKVEGLLLKLNSSISSAALQEPTLEAVMEIFAREEMPERVKRQQNYRLLMNRHIQPKWGSCALSKIRPFEVETWLKELDYSPETKRHIKSMLYRLFECAMKRGWLEAQRNTSHATLVRAYNKELRELIFPDSSATQVSKDKNDG